MFWASCLALTVCQLKLSTLWRCWCWDCTSILSERYLGWLPVFGPYNCCIGRYSVAKFILLVPAYHGWVYTTTFLRCSARFNQYLYALQCDPQHITTMTLCHYYHLLTSLFFIFFAIMCHVFSGGSGVCTDTWWCNLCLGLLWLSVSTPYSVLHLYRLRLWAEVHG